MRQLQPITSEDGQPTVYLEEERWEYIRANHIVEPPAIRGKGQTTWWPVIHTASGVSTMTEEEVLEMIVVAVQEGIWQNAVRGTLLSIYDVPHSIAEKTGVTEVRVSIAPDGKILSAYPTGGRNVLAMKEVEIEVHDPFADDDQPLGMTSSQQATSFGD